MNILIIGATRGIGLCVVKKALGEGNNVTALVRDPAKMSINHENLKVVKGDILDRDSIAKAVAGQDIVCCSIGTPPSRGPIRIFSEGTRIVIDAMKGAGVKRLICVTGIGAGDSKNHGGFVYDKIIFPLLLKSVYEDKDRQEKIIKASDTDWIIVRPAALTNGPEIGKYKVHAELTGITAGKISRADVAHFIVNQFVKPEYLTQTPLLTN